MLIAGKKDNGGKEGDRTRGRRDKQVTGSKAVRGFFKKILRDEDISRISVSEDFFNRDLGTKESSLREVALRARDFRE